MVKRLIGFKWVGYFLRWPPNLNSYLINEVVIMDDIEYNDFADLDYSGWNNEELEVEDYIE